MFCRPVSARSVGTAAGNLDFLSVLNYNTTGHQRLITSIRDTGHREYDPACGFYGRVPLSFLKEPGRGALSSNILSKRHLDLAGSYNIRDTGGYPTSDGRHMRWRRFIRADTLHRLPPESQAALIAYGLRTVIDLRNAREIRHEPCVFVNSGHVSYHHKAMVGDVLAAEWEETPASGTVLEKIFQSYTSVIDRRQVEICKILSMLALPGTLPTVVHCHGGKDRTGIMTALVLGVAGVPVDIIVEDYILSARFLLKRRADGRAPGVEAAYSTEEEYRHNCCPPEAMFSTLQHLSERYGGIESYLLDGGLDREHITNIRSALVE